MRNFFIFLCCIWPFTIWGQPVSDTLILHNDHFISMDITPFAGLFTDSSGALTIEDILAGRESFEPKFERTQETVYPAAHWLKIIFSTEENIADRWLIFKPADNQTRYPSYISYVDVYFVKEGQVISHHRSGYHVAKKEKSIPERASVSVIPFSSEQKETISLYIRLSQASKNRETPISLELSHPVSNISNSTGEYSWVIFGSQAMYTMIGLYMLVFWFFVRHSSYLYFGLFCILFSTHYLDIEPVSSFVDRFFPNHPHLAMRFSLLASSSSIFFLLFGRSFSELKERLPKWDKYLISIIVLYTLYFLYNTFFFLKEPYPPSGGVSMFIVFVLILPLSVKFLFGKHIFAKIFGLGILLFLFWNCMGLLWNSGLIKFPFNPWPVGQIGLLIVYGIGLAYKFMDGERLKVQAEQIRQLDAIKSRFFANISHEFRTPLSLILGPVNQTIESIPASEPIADEDELPVRGKHLKVIKRNALRLQSLVDQLLDLSKLDNGKMKLSVSEGNIIQFLRSIVFSFESLAERRHIHFNTSFPKDLGQAVYDRDKLEKILVNLLSNAFKFTPEHGTIRVIVEEYQGRIKIQIGDSGPGMNAEEIDKIFDRFYQVEGTEAQGTGIGLALVRELVNLHRGQISVDSIQGEGTNFKLVLPFRQNDFPPETIFVVSNEETALPVSYPDSEEVQHKLISQTSVQIDRPLALVVEDHPDLRHYIAENIQNQYQVIIARDGQEGLDMATEHIPDIVISDVMMPKMNGFELCQQLKTDQHTSHIPIILLTAKVGQDHKIEGLEQGADDYLTKPFDVRELNIRMANLIEQRKRLREKFGGEFRIGPAPVNLSSVDERFMTSVMQEIEKNMGNEFFTVEELAKSIGFSRSQLHRKLKALTDKSTNQLIREFRLNRAKELLEQNTASVSEIAYQVGYSNLSYFSKSYKEAFGKLPSESGYSS